jgi:DNA (cytosine-5)-methyltransferase 1
MIYGSVCSGIEAATQAWHPLGWQAAFFSEIEPFPSAALAHHYPSVPNHGDMTKFEEWPEHAIDLLVGGTPCQSFSVAGLRKGLDDPRGNLSPTIEAA